MKKLILIIPILLLSGCGYTAEERLKIEKEKQTTIQLKEVAKQEWIEQKGKEWVFCEDLCLSDWNGRPKMECTVTCINALKSGDLLEKF